MPSFYPELAAGLDTNRIAGDLYRQGYNYWLVINNLNKIYMSDLVSNRVELNVLHYYPVFLSFKVEPDDMGIGGVNKLFEAVLMGMKMNILLLTIDHARYIAFLPCFLRTFLSKFGPERTFDFNCLH